MSPNPLADGVRRQRLKWIVPVAILGVGAGLIGLLVALRPVVEPGPPNVDAPLVRTVIAEPREVRFTVRTQGTVKPRTESDLVAEVSGRIISVSPSLASGGFLEVDDAVVMIDPSDYEIAVERAKASVARTESQLSLARSANRAHSELATCREND